MAVPKYSDMLLPMLNVMGDGQERHVDEIVNLIANEMNLTEEDLTILQPNHKQPQLRYRLGWTSTYLKKSLLLKSTRRGYVKITDRGLRVLEEKPDKIDSKYLERFSEFVEFKTPNKSSQETDAVSIDASDLDLTPMELIDYNFRSITADLSEQLLEYVLGTSPAFFEQLVVDLLLAMGYGSALQNAGQTTQLVSDGGIDGYIQEDKLGLDTVYIQAKRWAIDNTVGRPQIQAFVGSLMGEGATKGVFITTSSFSNGAIEYAKSIQNIRIILIGGDQLAQLMIEHNVGVVAEKTYIVKKIDENYFPD